MIRNAVPALAVAIIAVLASLQAVADQPLAIHIHSEHAMFQVLVSPGTVGTDSFVLQLMSGEGILLPVKQATLVLTLPERGLQPLERKATLGADGYWHVEDIALSFAGRWHLRIEAQTAFQTITLEDDFDMPAK
jgi:copper transport protein